MIAWGSGCAVRRGVAVLLVAGVAGCGGGGSGGNASSGAAGSATETEPGCSLLERRTYLAGQFRDAYYWTRLTPDLDPGAERTIDDYFRGSLFRGNESLPSDRYSGYQTTEAYNRTFGEGNTMGFGLAVAGQEVRGQPDQPLYIRDVNPESPAWLAGLRRSDRVVALNGRSARDVIAADDFSALTADVAGVALSIEVERNGVRRIAELASAVHPITPVRHARMVNLPDGRRLGLIRVQSMITMADPEFTNTFSQFRDANVAGVILDLRYNGGGSVAVGARLASHAAGTSSNGQLYAELRYNELQQSRNSQFRFSHTLGWQGVKRVYVLAGSRTCSASEQVIAGLRGIGVDVVLIGSTTCGKPVGFTPVSQCGLTYSITNFESINARGVGAYYNGFSPDCAVAEDFTKSMEDPTEPLSAAAVAHAMGQGCPKAVGTERGPLARPGPALKALRDGPELPGVMVP